MSSEHVFEAPERFVVGTVGRPGERTFYLQVVSAGAIVTVALEKAEVAALAEGLQVLLQQVGVTNGAVVEPAPSAKPKNSDLPAAAHQNPYTTGTQDEAAAQ